MVTSNRKMISVIVPTYNNEDYILHALYSIFEQTYREYEIIIIDDGSTDSTRDRLKSYWNRIHYHYQENQGLAVARNVGLEMASGEYVTFLDGDDIWLPDNLMLKMKVLSRRPELGGVFSEFSVFNADGLLHERGTKLIFPFFNRTRKDFKDIFDDCESISANSGKHVMLYSGKIFDDLFMGNFILPSTMVFRKKYADAVGRFLPHLRTQQDYEYWLRFSKKHSFGFINEVLVQYRRHQKQLTNFTNIKKIICSVLWIINQYENEFNRAEKKTAFRKRKAELLKNLAIVSFRLKEREDARSLLLEGIQLNPLVFQNYLYYCLTYLPADFVQFGVSVYRNIRMLKNDNKK